MINKTVILHFTFGPVQDFVAQSRRTRDLWAGSYLISYLAGCAMEAIDPSGEKIIFPAVQSDHLFQALINPDRQPSSHTELAACVGSLPNRFKARVPENFHANQYKDTIKMKWLDISNAVKTALQRNSSIVFDENLWNCQTKHLWEFTWVIGEEDSLLDFRKNLRTHAVPPAKGEKCTLCGERQELSGKGLGTKSSRDEMDKWWKNLRNSTLNPDQQTSIKGATLFDLRESERLCAVCLVKRAFPFPAIAKKAFGWEVPVNYPSTHYMSAIDWITRVFDECNNGEKANEMKAAIKAFVQAADKAGLWYSEMKAGIKGIEVAGKAGGLDEEIEITNDAGRKIMKPIGEAFAALDGGAFFQSVIRNDKEFDVDEQPVSPGKNRQALIDALKLLQGILLPKRGQSREATPFYALLLMDGDGMGKLLYDYPDQQANISTALAQFTRKVAKVVEDCNGRLIYAGGDDVFALLPMNTAIECARQCREKYEQAFEEHTTISPARATISAAIEYAHMQTALGVVVKDAHRLLDDVAKESCGRDGLACRVWKRGGLILTWAQPWKVVLGKSPCSAVDAGKLDIIDEIKWLFQEKDDDPAKFSSKFFYKLRDLFDLVAPSGKHWLPDEAMRNLLATEYIANRKLPGDLAIEEAEQRVARLLELCRKRKRSVDAAGNEQFEPGDYQGDGALLIRFLVQKEV